MQIQDPDFGELTYDEDLGAWVGTIELHSFGACALKYDLSWGGEIRQKVRDDDPRLLRTELNVSDDDRAGPTPIQRAALRLLLGREKQVASAVLRECARVVREGYLAEAQLGPGKPALTTQKDLADRLGSEAGVVDWLSQPRVEFHHTGEDGTAYVSFNFAAGVDEEHGLAVLMLGDRVVEVGGAAEFYDR